MLSNQSNSTTSYASSSKETKADEQETSDLLNSDVENMIIETLGDKGVGSSQNYQPKLVGTTLSFLEQAIPLIALCRHVIRSELKEAKAILTKVDDPIILRQMLTTRCTVTDYSDRRIEGTAFQLALGAEDVSTIKVLKQYIETLPDGKTLITKQYDEQFPTGWKEVAQKQAQQDLFALQQVIKTIGDTTLTNSTYEAYEAACEPALVEFRAYLDAQSKTNTPLKTGKHFNVDLLVKAFQLYDKNYNLFNGTLQKESSPKNTLCWRKLIGYIQRYLPACYAKEFCEDPFSTRMHSQDIEDLKPFQFRDNEDTTYYFPLLRSSGLGYEHAAIYGKVKKNYQMGWQIFHEEDDCPTYYLSKSLLSKKTDIAALMPEPQSTHSLNILKSPHKP